ncbi:MAG: type II toxin-antitoxin system RelE/ParE family toxin [Opitutaceae bacterium]|nr:type II toxin-antitoxin system RelE/ParE family toxin [Opitutaceae bacterium]
MKPAIFHPEADDEFADAIAYYAGRGEGLGERFYEEMLLLTAQIEAAPRLHRLWRHGIRRHLATHFPYALIYVEKPDHVAILAVAHCKRRPGYWRDRLR